MAVAPIHLPPFYILIVTLPVALASTLFILLSLLGFYNLRRPSPFRGAFLFPLNPSPFRTPLPGSRPDSGLTSTIEALDILP